MMECNNGKARLGYLCFFFFSSFSKAFPLFSFLFHISVRCGRKSLKTLALGEEISNHIEVNDTTLDVRKPLVPMLPAWHPPPTWTASPEKPWLRAHCCGEPQKTKERGKIVLRVFYDLHTASSNVNILHNDGTFIKIKKLASVQ